MKNKISCIISIIVTISLLSTTIPSLLQSTTANNNSVQILECTSNTYFNEWHYYKLITINHEKVEADLNNFPVLLSIQDIDLRDKAQPDGDDIAFSNQNGTPLNHEIESYNSTTGNLTAWINITSISSSTNTTLYMYYGNPNCENQQNVLDVWNSDYIMVQHLEEDAGTTVFDSTSNNNDGISTGTTFNEECKINGGREYEGDILEFSTIEQQQLSVEITQPEENYFYIRNMKLLQLNNKTFIYGPITITANVASNTDIEKVEFYVDGNKKHTDEETPYEYNWSPIISFKRTIKVIAYDGEGNIASDEVEVLKWRLHPLLLMAGAAAVLNPNTKLLRSLSGYTIVRGFVFNIKHTGETVTFCAIRLHYTKVKLLSTESGVIHLKKCTITSGLDTKIAMGPFGSVSWIFCVYKGTSPENPTFLQTIECGHG